MNKTIEIKNAHIHNLKNVSVSIPKNKLTVITGVSGSGKSSLAFDTLYEEGKKRYLIFSGSQFTVDSESSFESITGLSPTVAVEQRIIRQSNPRSTVGTRIKIEAMLAALLANYGEIDDGFDTGEPLEIACFQKNSSKGMCLRCMGAGTNYSVDEDALFFDMSKTIARLFGKDGEQTHYKHLMYALQRRRGIDTNRTLSSLSEEEFELIKYGDGQEHGYKGIVPWVIDCYRYFNYKERYNWITDLQCVGDRPCRKCGGTGLSAIALHTRFAGKTISELQELYIDELQALLESVSDGHNRLLEQIILKLKCLSEVGLRHLSLSRPVPSLSGGEIQRLFLASYIIAEMDSIIFVFDEPTIGLHEVEKENLIRIIKNLVTAGNTVVAVEHDENFMKNADYIIDIGPDAGEFGGEKIFEGSYREFLKCKGSRIAPYLSGEGFDIRRSYRPVDMTNALTIENADIHNLRKLTVKIPLGVMVGVAGVSGSGKSSLIAATLVPKLKDALKTRFFADDIDGEHSGARLLGAEKVKKCYIIDQRPIGRSRTSCPATYTGIFDRVRTLFAGTDEAKAKGYKVGMFSLNSTGGCKKCKGEGVVHYYVGMGNFMDVICEDCHGCGFVPETMSVHLDGKNICEILEMSVDEAVGFFREKDRVILNILETLQRVGMGYIKLGQATPTISGGESQRIKLARELSKGGSNKGSLYILDEPTTGLSFYDSKKLLKLMNELTDSGCTIIVTEHDPYILSNCDYLIELGRGGGNEGGDIIAVGTPEQLHNNPDSIIGGYLK